MKKINIIKIGSSSLVEKEKGFRKDVIKNLIKYISKKIRKGELCILISSGAVAKGKFLLKDRKKEHSKALYAVKGQGALNKMYEKKFAKKGIKTANILLSEGINEKHFHKTILEVLSLENLLIINHNDAISNSELKKVSKFTDNDKTALEIGRILIENDQEGFNYKLKQLTLITDTDGVLNEKGKTVFGGKFNSKKRLKKFYNKLLNFVDDGKGTGTGGMRSKIESCYNMAKHLISVKIIGAKSLKGTKMKLKK